MQCKVGTFISGGADYNIPIGFVPDYLMVINENAAAAEIVRIEWFGTEMGVLNEIQTKHIDEDGTGTHVSHVAITDDASGHVLALIETSTPAIASSNLSQSGFIGVTLDATTFHADGDVIRYLALRGDHTEDHGDIG